MMPPIVWSILAAVVLLLLAKYVSGWILVVGLAFCMVVGAGIDTGEDIGDGY